METEEWRDINGYEGCYQISSLGRVFSIKRNGTLGGIISLVPDKDGYLLAHLSINNFAQKWRVHELVANAFIGAPASNDLQVNHINCIKTDNAPSNLEWCTGQQNIIHAYKNGLINQSCENNHAAKIDNKIALAVLSSRGRQRDIAKEHNISQSLVSSIKRGKTWSAATGVPPPTEPAIRTGESNPYSKITESQAIEIFHAKGKHRDVGLLYGVCRESVWNIKNGKSWRHLGLRKSA